MPRKYDDLAVIERAKIVIREQNLQSLQEVITTLGIPRSSFYSVLHRQGISGSSELLAFAEQEPEPLQAAALKAIKNKPKSLEELANLIDASPAKTRELVDRLISENYNIVISSRGIVLDTKTVKPPDSLPSTLLDSSGQWIEFGVIADIHAGSMYEQITNRNKFINLAYEEGIRRILIAGDLFAGINVYRGQVHELYAHGADAQERVLAAGLPQLDDLQYHCIGGNHDFSFVRAGGRNAVAGLAHRRDDVYYWGFDAADIPLLPNVHARLWHPSGGIPYSVSYRIQKGLEQVAAEQLVQAILSRKNPKLRFLFAGHLHVEGQASLGPIKGYQIPCFEGKNGYLQSKGLTPIIGGVIMWVYITSDGLISRLRAEPIYGDEIKQDYLNYPDLIAAAMSKEPRSTETLFEWKADD